MPWAFMCQVAFRAELQGGSLGAGAGGACPSLRQSPQPAEAQAPALHRLRSDRTGEEAFSVGLGACQKAFPPASGCRAPEVSWAECPGQGWCWGHFQPGSSKSWNWHRAVLKGKPRDMAALLGFAARGSEAKGNYLILVFPNHNFLFL